MVKKTSHTGALSPEYVFLGLLTMQPTHGYELHQRLGADLGQIWHISLSQTYNILNRLESKGFIHGETEGQDKLPSRRIFQLSEAGHQRFEEWLHTPSGSSVRAIRVEFTTRLYFAHRMDQALAEQLIETQISETTSGLARLQALMDEISQAQVFNRLGLELRIRQLASIIEWLQKCRQTLITPQTIKEQVQ